MENKQSSDEIRKAAVNLDNAIEKKDTEKILSSFSDDCEIELLGIKLKGKEGVRRWINWLYKHLAEVRFLPVTIMIDDLTIPLAILYFPSCRYS